MNIESLKHAIHSSFSFTDDLILRNLTVGNHPALLVFLDGGSDKTLLDRDVISPILALENLDGDRQNVIANTVHYCENFKVVPLNDCPQNIADGDVALVIEDDDNAYIFSVRGSEKRSIAEPPTESVMKGPREGFIEEIKSNLSLVRRRIKSPSLVVKTLSVGRYSSTTVAVLHVHGVADERIVREITDKISLIDVDGVVDSAYIIAFLQPNKHSFFLQAGTTEKPDVASAKLLEGRVIILVDGSPIAITLPYLIFEDVQDGYDYYSEDWRASMIRILRMLGAILTVILPGAYVALQTFHYGLLPLKFLTTLLAATNGIPFPPAIEMLIVLVLFEILNQASIRMPRYFGISLSVVGAIVLGDTAVKSGLISSPSVLVIALSAIGIFCVPDQVGVMSILRLLFLLVSAVLGFVGIIILSILIVGYLSSLENFGTPYLAPYAPRINPDLKDGFLKVGAREMKERPYSIPNSNRTRES